MNCKRTCKALSLVMAAVMVGVVAWVQTRDAGVVVSLGFSALYVMLWTLNVPRREWANAVAVESQLATDQNHLVLLKSPCRVVACEDAALEPKTDRHFHFCECLEMRAGERMVRMYGLLVLVRSWVRDIRYQWLFGVLSAGLTTVVFVVLWDDAASGAGEFDPWKAAVATVVGVFHLGMGAYGLIWFRKRADELLA